MNRPELINQKQDELLQSNGYVVLKNVLPKSLLDEFEEARKSLMSQHRTTDPVFWNTLWNTPIKEFNTFNDFFLPKVIESLKGKVQNYEVLQVTLMVKLIGKDTYCNPHRDFSILNEEQNQYWNAWAPIFDINHACGPLTVLPKSNKLFNQIRPFNAPWLYNHHIELINTKSNIVYPEKGDLVIYLENTIHGSIVNTTENVRPNLHFGILPQNANFKYFHHKSENKVWQYAVDKNFYLNREIEMFNEKDFEPNFEKVISYNPIPDKVILDTLNFM